MTKKCHKCAACEGSGKFPYELHCQFCNGTGEENNAAKSYVNNHICQCIVNDRKNCPVCKKECHHDTTLAPKQTIDGGYGGISSKPKYKEPKEPEIIIE